LELYPFVSVMQKKQSSLESGMFHMTGDENFKLEIRNVFRTVACC